MCIIKIVFAIITTKHARKEKIMSQVNQEGPPKKKPPITRIVIKPFEALNGDNNIVPCGKDELIIEEDRTGGVASLIIPGKEEKRAKVTTYILNGHTKETKLGGR